MNGKNVIVNASALRSSGGLIILQQFISEIPIDDRFYFIFVDKSVTIENATKNVQIITTSSTSFFRRFICSN